MFRSKRECECECVKVRWSPLQPVGIGTRGLRIFPPPLFPEAVAMCPNWNIARANRERSLSLVTSSRTVWPLRLDCDSAISSNFNQWRHVLYNTLHVPRAFLSASISPGRQRSSFASVDEGKKITMI